MRQREPEFRHQHDGQAGRWAGRVRECGTGPLPGGVQVRVCKHAGGTRHAPREQGRQLLGRVAHRVWALEFECLLLVMKTYAGLAVGLLVVVLGTGGYLDQTGCHVDHQTGCHVA